MATVSTRVDVRERRSFSVGDKRRIVGAYRAAVASGEGGGVVLRREGIYQSLVFKWGRQIDDGTLGTRRRGPAATGKDPAKIRVREYGIGVHSSSPMVANRFVDRGVHLDGDREPNVGFAAGGGDRTRVKPRIGTQRQRPGRPGTRCAPWSMCSASSSVTVPPSVSGLMLGVAEIQKSTASAKCA